MTTDEVPEPWERQPDESDVAFEAFTVYRDLGPQRSQAAVANQINRELSQMKAWSLKHRWVTRSLAWDDHLDAVARNAMERARVDMGRKHADAAMKMLEVGLEGLETVREKMQQPDVDPKDVREFIEAAIKLERLARGEAESVSEQRRVGKTVKAMTDDELESICARGGDGVIASA